jgi:hypothetical protein
MTLIPPIPHPLTTTKNISPYVLRYHNDHLEIIQ